MSFWSAPESSVQEEKIRPNTLQEQASLNNALDHLLEYFTLRGFKMTSGEKCEEETYPIIISTMNQSPADFRCLETLADIKAAGPGYLEEFYDFITDHIFSTL